MAKIVFTAELSFDSDNAATFDEAYKELQRGMSRYRRPCDPFVTVYIKSATHDGILFEKKSE